MLTIIEKKRGHGVWLMVTLAIHDSRRQDWEGMNSPCASDACLPEGSQQTLSTVGCETLGGPGLAPSYCGRTGMVLDWAQEWVQEVPGPGGPGWGIAPRVCGCGHLLLLSLPMVQWYWSWKEEKRKWCFKHDVKIRIKQLLVFGGATSVTNIKQNSLSGPDASEGDTYPSALLSYEDHLFKRKSNSKWFSRKI